MIIESGVQEDRTDLTTVLGMEHRSQGKHWVTDISAGFLEWHQVSRGLIYKYAENSRINPVLKTSNLLENLDRIYIPYQCKQYGNFIT